MAQMAHNRTAAPGGNHRIPPDRTARLTQRSRQDHTGGGNARKAPVFPGNPIPDDREQDG